MTAKEQELKKNREQPLSPYPGTIFTQHEVMYSWAVWTLHIIEIVLSIRKKVKPGKVKRRNTRDGKKHDSAKQTSVEKQKRIILYSKRENGG